jgi:uncharacterized membrane protein
VRRFLLARLLLARPRLVLGALAGIAAFFLLPATLAPLTRAIMAWDIGCAVFLALLAEMFGIERRDRIARDAAMQEEGEWTIFAVTVGAVAASFAAIIGEFSAVKDLPATVRGLHIGLVAATLLLSWLMTHTLFCMRYAHEYYTISPGRTVPDGGLLFPDEAVPDYWDFFYFAMVLGMTFQVSDVQITSAKLRRLATVHGLLGFVFNTVVLALSVNIGASLL